MHFHGGQQIRLRSFYKVYKKRCVIPLNKTHSVVVVELHWGGSARSMQNRQVSIVLLQQSATPVVVALCCEANLLLVLQRINSFRKYFIQNQMALHEDIYRPL